MLYTETMPILRDEYMQAFIIISETSKIVIDSDVWQCFPILL